MCICVGGVCVCACGCICVCLCLFVACVCVCIYERARVLMNALLYCVHTRTLRTCAYVRVRVRVHVCMRACIYDKPALWLEYVVFLHTVPSRPQPLPGVNI